MSDTAQAEIVRQQEKIRYLERQLELQLYRTEALAHLMSNLMHKVQLQLAREPLLDYCKNLPEIQKELSQILGGYPPNMRVATRPLTLPKT